MIKGIRNIFKASVRQSRPLINEVPFPTRNGRTYGFSNNLQKKKAFWNWFRSRPELNAPVMIRVDDTIGEVEFLDVDGAPLSKLGLKKAKNFWYDNQMYERLKSVQFDRLITGDGYLWLGKFSNMREADKEEYLKELRGVCSRQAKNQLGGVSVRETEELSNKLFLRAIDEDSRIVRKVDYVASSTMEIEHNNRDITGYRQHSTVGDELFSTKEILHLPLYRLDGRIQGFSPVESLNYELLLLWTIKENMMAYFRNGGVPSRIFVLPEEIANSENHSWLTQQLMDRGALENRHGNLVLTGNVDIKDLEKDVKDMEYKDLALYVTSNIAYALRVPKSRIPYMIGDSGGDAGGLAESGYWTMIESDQRTLEMHLNQQLCNKLGFSVRFRRTYKIDDVREAQAANQWIAYVNQTDTLLKNRGLKIKDDILVAFASRKRDTISISDVEKMSKDELGLGQEKNSLLNQTFMKDKEVLPESKKQNIAETKKKVANDNNSGGNQGGF